MLTRQSEDHLGPCLVLGVALAGEPREIENGRPERKQGEGTLSFVLSPKCHSVELWQTGGGSWQRVAFQASLGFSFTISPKFVWDRIVT